MRTNSRTDLKKVISMILALALSLCFTIASAEDSELLGKPFPEFTATDTEGNTLTLSEMLKDHEAVLINIWATWCTPCSAEMGFLNEAYAQYGDRVAFIVLSREDNDTMEAIRAYREERGLDFPMGRDEGETLYRYTGGQGIPTSVIVDRFGNAAFLHVGSFLSTGEVTRVIEAFLGEGYTETAVLSEIPRDASTLAFPVSADRAIHVENEDAKCVLFRQEGNPIPRRVYVIHDDVAHLRLEITAEDDPTVVTYYNLSDIEILQSLLDPERNAYVIDQPMPDPDTGDYYIFGALVPEDNDLTKAPSVYLIPDEEYIERLAEDLRSRGYDVTWEYGDYIPPEQPWIQSYLLHIVDQNGDPVPGVLVNFCTDTTCSPTQSDENGIISFGGAPDVYHIQLLKAPEGYSFDADFELYTEAEYGEWLLRIRKES